MDFNAAYSNGIDLSGNMDTSITRGEFFNEFQSQAEDPIVFDVQKAMNKYRDLKRQMEEMVRLKADIKQRKDSLYELRHQLLNTYSKLSKEIRNRDVQQEWERFYTKHSQAFEEKTVELSSEHIRLHNSIEEIKHDIGILNLMLKEGVASSVSEEEIERLRDPNLCAICITNKVQYAFNPCGHTLCGECNRSEQMNRCHLCRKPVINVIKLFFS